MEDLIIKFGYPALFVGSFLEGESVLIAAGFLARGGYLNLKLVMLVALTATYIADVSLYLLGRSKGERVIAKFPIATTYYPKVKTLFDRYGIWAIFITRYLYGLRLASAATFGLMKMRRRNYLPFNLLSCMIWAVLMGGLGYLFGASLEAIIGQVKHYEKIVVAFIILVGLSVWLFRRAQSRRECKKNNELRTNIEDSEAQE
ncbi:MAG: DedA family protein [Candidatus Zixiibacteriota bacterium]